MASKRKAMTQKSSEQSSTCDPECITQRNFSDSLVCVLILNYDSLEDTLKCVETVRNSKHKNVRILVIDNASPDESGPQLASRLAPHEFMQLDENTGYAGGNNIGLKAALDSGAEFVFILNPDTRLTRHTISACIETLGADRSIGAINPIQLCNNKNLIDRKFRNTVLHSAGIDIDYYQAGELADEIEVRDLLGAALVVPRHAIEKIGGFDPLYFAYGEETDLCRRLRLHGFRLVVAGNATVLHLRSKETEGVSDFVIFLRLKGIYLGRLKDPWRGFQRSVRMVTGLFLMDLFGRRSNEYPFNQYPVTRLHVLRAFWWVMVRLVRIRKHRLMERAGRAHL